jgi:predicted component of type VI protein secretion system
LQSIDSAAKLTFAGGEADVQLRSSVARVCCCTHIPNTTAFAPDLLAKAAFIPIRSSITSADMQQKSLTQLRFQGGHPA